MSSGETLPDPNVSRGCGGAAGLGFSLRLSLVFSAIFAAGVTALFALSYYSIAASLAEQEREAVRDRVREYRAWFREGGLAALRSRFEEQGRASPELLFLRVTGRSGEVLFFSNPRSGFRIEPRDLRNLPDGTSLVRFRGDGESHRWTVVSAPLPGGMAIQAGKSSRSMDRVLARFRRRFVLYALAGLLLATAGGTAVAFQGMRPIRRLVATLHDILRTGELGCRVPTGRGEDELSDLSRLFNRLLDRNQQLIDAMHGSLEAVAHDLRTPMTRLRNIAEQALAEPGDSDRTREALAGCLEESDEALELLHSLTEIAEAEAGALRLNLGDVPAAELAAKVAELYEFVAEERNIELQVDVPDKLSVRVDRIRTQQMLANLVDNALKYSPSGTRILIRGREYEGRVHLSVLDEGPGIPETELPRIWDRLYRGDSSRSERGLGLGLSLVRAVAEAHGGRAKVRNRTDQSGAEFTLELPRPEAAAPTSRSGGS